MGAKSGDPAQARPFSFLTSIGGKETNQARVTLRTGPGLQGTGTATMPLGTGSFLGARHQRKRDGEEEEGDGLAIFTDMDVDKHDHEPRRG